MSKNYLLRLYKYAYKSSAAKLVVIGAILPLIISILMPEEVWFPGNDSMEGIFSPDDLKSPITVISVILIAPLWETLIQYVPVWLSVTYLSKFKYAHVLVICIASAFFAWLHPSGSHQTALFLASCVWSFLCLVFMRRKDSPYLRVVLMHGLYNTILVCLMAIALIFEVFPEV